MDNTPHLRGPPQQAAATMRDGKKDEDEAYDPFAGLDKGSVLQETRLFDDPKVRDHGATIRTCRLLMTKVLYMLGQVRQVARLRIPPAAAAAAAPPHLPLPLRARRPSRAQR